MNIILQVLRYVWETRVIINCIVLLYMKAYKVGNHFLIYILKSIYEGYARVSMRIKLINQHASKPFQNLKTGTICVDS